MKCPGQGTWWPDKDSGRGGGGVGEVNGLGRISRRQDRQDTGDEGQECSQASGLSDWAYAADLWGGSTWGGAGFEPRYGLLFSTH